MSWQGLFTYKGRLPMGTPTSPVLSNLAAIPLDNALTGWAGERGATFTRFVDDLTFSSTTAAFSPKYLKEITAICDEHRLNLNPFKTKFFRRKRPQKSDRAGATGNHRH